MDEESFDNYTYDLGVRIYDLVKKEVQLYSPDTVNLSPVNHTLGTFRFNYIAYQNKKKQYWQYHGDANALS